MKKIDFDNTRQGHTKLEGAAKLQWALTGPLHRLAGALDTMARQHPDIAEELYEAQIALLTEAKDIHSQYLEYREETLRNRASFSEEAKTLCKSSGIRMLGISIKDTKKNKGEAK